MLRKVLDLLIAVTFVFAVEAVFSMFNNNTCDNIIDLEFFFLSRIDSEKFWIYFIPAVALIVHIAQVAHYHQKRDDWGIEEQIRQKVEGIWEFFQISFIMIPVVCLILVSRFIPLKMHREYIIYLLLTTYFSYFIGDMITKKKLKYVDIPVDFRKAVNTVFWTDLTMACVCFLMICLQIKQKIKMGIISGTIISITIFISLRCWRFLYKEKPQTGSAHS
jgi:hypothetical protein